MHYAYELVVLAANTVSNPVRQKVVLGAGIIRHMSFIFPPGCARLVRCYFMDQAVQLLPTNVDAFYSEDGYAVEVDCYIKMLNVGNVFWLVGWAVGTTYPHNVHVLIDVEGIDEPKELDAIKLLSEAINNLVQLMRSWF